ncbi:MAG TPA: hypothetical protein VF992_00515 [Thermoplasmata archaeon]
MGPPPSPPPPSQSWYPVAPRRSTTPQLIAVVVFVVIAAVAMVSIVMTGTFLPSFLPFMFCIPFLFVFLVIILAVLSGQGRRSIPPPPPIQQPMVPAGQQGPIALSCPNCGGPPTNVDRFGIATCQYCGTRFLVR